MHRDPDSRAALRRVIEHAAIGEEPAAADGAPIPTDPALGELLSYVAELEAENARLESLNAELTASVAAATVGENRYLALVDWMPDTSVYVFDRSARVIAANQRALERRGHDLIGKHPEDFFDPDSARTAYESIAQAAESGAFSFDRTATSSGYDVCCVMVPVDQPGGPESLLLVRDVTRINQQERQFADAESRWKVAFHRAPVAMAEISEQGVFVAANPAMSQLTGRPWRQLAGTSFLDLLHPDDRVAGEGRAAQVGNGESNVWMSQRRILRPDGSVVWVSLHGSVMGGAGDGQSVLLHLVDMTAEVAQKRAIEQAAARYSALVEHNPDLIAVVDADFVVRYLSPAYQIMLGHDPATALGVACANRVHPDDLETLKAGLAEATTIPGGTVTYEIRVQAADGDYRTLEITATNHLANPAIEGIVCNCRDVTDRAAEAARLAHRATHDGLTGLANRALIEHRLAASLTQEPRPEGVCAVLYIDLDGFKAINDSLGHASGDQVLATVAHRLNHVVRGDDRVGRLGGDEFLVITGNLGSVDAALEIAERVRRAVEEPIQLADRRVRIGCSIGVTTAPYDRSPADMMAEADFALYEAKALGRNRWQLFSGVA